MPTQGYTQPLAMSATVRPMAESERQAIKAIPRPQKMNAVGISLMAMLMAVMVNFVDNPVAMFMPLVFAFAALGLAVQARKTSGAVAATIAKGTVTEVRGVPLYKGNAGWEFGVFSIARDKQLERALVDGAPASVAIVPDAKRLLSVNGVTLRRPVALRTPPGFENMLAAYAAPPRPVQRMPVAPSFDQDLPPPPDGWGAKFCPKCGEPISGDYLFCRKCGFRLKA